MKKLLLSTSVVLLVSSAARADVLCFSLCAVSNPTTASLLASVTQTAPSTGTFLSSTPTALGTPTGTSTFSSVSTFNPFGSFVFNPANTVPSTALSGNTNFGSMFTGTTAATTNAFGSFLAGGTTNPFMGSVGINNFGAFGFANTNFVSSSLGFGNMGFGTGPTAVPEPATFLMLGSGLLLTGYLLKRQARKARAK